MSHRKNSHQHTLYQLGNIFKNILQALNEFLLIYSVSQQMLIYLPVFTIQISWQ